MKKEPTQWETRWALLDERERQIIGLRFHHKKSFSEIGKSVGLSKTRALRLCSSSWELLMNGVTGSKWTTNDWSELVDYRAKLLNLFGHGFIQITDEYKELIRRV